MRLNPIGPLDRPVCGMLKDDDRPSSTRSPQRTSAEVSPSTSHRVKSIRRVEQKQRERPAGDRAPRRRATGRLPRRRGCGPARPSVSMLSLRARTAPRSLSTNVAGGAPSRQRLEAQRAASGERVEHRCRRPARLPQNDASDEKSASRTRSVVGRVASPLGAFERASAVTRLRRSSSAAHPLPCRRVGALHLPKKRSVLRSGQVRVAWRRTRVRRPAPAR